MPQTIVERWFSRLDSAHKAKGMAEWDDCCGVIKKKYLFESSKGAEERRYQIFWSNIQQLQSAIYAKTPKAVVDRRYSDEDPIANLATRILERSINFSLDTGDFHSCFKRVRDDFLLYGRGVARVYYEPTYSIKDDEEEDITGAEDTRGDKGNSYSDTSGSGSASPARGVSSDQVQPSETDKAAISSPEEPDKPSETLDFENVRIRFVHRQDFAHDPARVWEEVNWVAFRAFMTKKEVSARFGEEIADKLVIGNEKDVPDATSSEKDDDPDGKTAIWEIWDRKEDEVLWIAQGYDEPLERGSPYLELDGFFPCPPPVFGTLTNDSLIPRPDYVFYQDQVDEIDQLTARIGALTDALKLVGFYPGGPQGEGAPEIERALRPGFENKMIAVQSWAAFKEGGGQGGVPILFLPMEQVGAIIEGCVKLRQQIVEDVYQIVGLSDIMRGATDPHETAQAQQMKAQFGGVRIRDKQDEIARFCAGITKLIGQIISKHCDPFTIEKMTNIKLPTQQDAQQAMMQYRQKMAPMVQQYQQVAMQAKAQGQQPPSPPQIPPPPNLGPTEEDVFGLLRDDVERLFRIDIEVQSTVVGDESQEKQDRTQLIESVTKFMEVWGPMVQANPMLAPLSGALLKFGTRAFRTARELEDVIEQTIQKIEQAAQGAQTGGHPDPKAQAEQIKLQGMQVKGQAEIQKAQIEAQSAQMEAQAKLQAIQLKADADRQKTVMDTAKSHVAHQQNVVQMHHQANLNAAGEQHKAAVDALGRAHQAHLQQQQAAQEEAQQPQQGEE
jgi:hypothetical protein